MAQAQGKPVSGWAARDTSGILSPYSFSTRSLKDNDVCLKVLFCGICHTDLHIIKNDWNNAMYPVVPGHEVIGTVTEVGRNVQKFQVGETVGVGYFVDSCLSCQSCKNGYENYCDKMVTTTNGVDHNGAKTCGGFSDKLVVDEHYVLNIPDGLPLEKTAPLLCAGVTVYSPLMYFGLNVEGKHLGVVGLGGVGHVAVKFGKAFGMKVTVISTSPEKEKEAIEHLGADSFLISKNPEQMQAAMGTMDGIFDTVAASHPIEPLIALLKPQGKLVMVGGVSKPYQLPAFSIIPRGKIVAGSCVGGMKDAQEMLKFAAKHAITAEVEVVKMDYVNTAFERLQKGDVRYRFVVDVGNSTR